jgi:hypothetical protein
MRDYVGKKKGTKSGLANGTSNKTNWQYYLVF